MICESAKHGYYTHDAAMRVARWQMQRQRGVILNVYRCDACHRWHLSSTPAMKSYQTLKYLRMRRDVEWT